MSKVWLVQKKGKGTDIQLGKKKGKNTIKTGCKRGRKHKTTDDESSTPSTSTQHLQTLTECFRVVNSGENECEHANYAPNELSSSEESSDSNSNNGDSYIDRCEQETVENNLIGQMLRKFQECDLLTHFMSCVHGICGGIVKPKNISILLAMEYCYLMSLSKTTAMRYREDSCKFWETALAVGGPKLMRLFSSDKHFGQVNNKKSCKLKYNPQKGNFNFAVPDDKILRKSKTNIPNYVECGIINEGIEMLDNNKQYMISLDGKQTGKGLWEIPRGDVNLWGIEGPPSLKDTIEQSKKEINFFDMLALKLMDEDNLCAEAVKELNLHYKLTRTK